MRIITIPLLILGVLAVVPPTRADENPKALVEKAVQAMGGLDRLGQSVATWRKARGLFHEDNQSFEGDSYSDKGRIKIVHRSGTKDEPQLRILVMDDEKGWISFNGTILDLGADSLERMKRARFADKVAGLVTLLRDKGYTLSYEGEVQIKDKPAHTIRVKHEGQPDIQLYFDKQAGYLVKTAQKFTEPGNAAEVLHELYYLNYQPLLAAATDEKLLREAGLGTSSAALLEFIAKKTPKAEIKVQINRLIEDLRSPSFRTRSKATAELKKHGLTAAAALREALNDPDTEVTRRARSLLDQLAEHPEMAQLPAALRLLALRKPAGAVSTLLNYLPWAPDEKLAESVKATLAAVAFRDGQPDPALVQAVRAGNASTRATIEAILQKDRKALDQVPGRRLLIEGVVLPRRCEMYRNGKRHMDLETLEVEFYNRHPDSLFLRPGEQQPQNPVR